MHTDLAAQAATSTGEALQFWVLGSVAVLGALGTVLLRRAVHAALCLAGTMVILAMFYLANGAYFLGIVQIVVYTGAVMMLFLFVLMLVGVSAADSLKETLKGQRWLAAGCGLGLGILLLSGLAQTPVSGFVGLARANAGGNVPALASQLFTRYVVAFEVVGALLTVAAVGATLLTHREKVEKTKSQREQAEERVRRGTQLPPLPAPGVYARHNAVDRPGLLPDGTPSELTVSSTLRERGQVREVSRQELHSVAALEERTADRYGQQLGTTVEEPAAEGESGRPTDRPGATRAGLFGRRKTGGGANKNGHGNSAVTQHAETDSGQDDGNGDGNGAVAATGARGEGE